MKKVIFSGRMYSGKDYVAQLIDSQIVGLSDPLYELAEYFFGTYDKSCPGMRDFLQKIAQWGWGANGERYPFTPERASFVEQVRRNGHLMTKNFFWVNWREYGLRQDFWVNVLRQSVRRLEKFAPVEVVAVPNGRFRHELDPLTKDGFMHFHVRCSEETRRERMEALGASFDEHANTDISEQLAVELNETMPAEQVVWNDHRPDTVYGGQALTPEQFRERIEHEPVASFLPKEPAHEVPVASV